MANPGSSMPEQGSTSTPSENGPQFTPGQSEPSDGESTEHTPKGITKRILEYVQRSRVVFILGLLRCDKSSLFEALVGERGYAGDGIHSVTREYQLGRARIDGQFYIFVDTPGFDDTRTTSEEVFRNIVSCIETVREHSIFTGILYVHELNSIYSTGHAVFISWLEAFCGTQYLKYVTFVKTKLDEFNPRHLEKKLAMLDEWMQYAHGGHDLDIILDEEADKDERRNQAIMMMTRCYKWKPSLYPWIVVELKQGTQVEDTAAGRVLGLRPPTYARSPESGPDWFQMLIDIPPGDSEDDSDDEFEAFNYADERDVDLDDLSAGIRDTPDERELAEALRQVMQGHRNYM
ncbi:hypothetical protein GGI43DRAFT_384317 [Trichoderma evansii]